jgi:pre-mRNA-processing factor 40
MSAKPAFKELLEDFEVTSRHKWDETAKQIKADERFDALKTLGEKKQCFNEYQTQRAKHEREQKRLAEKATRNEFTAMLHERVARVGRRGSVHREAQADASRSRRRHPRIRGLHGSRM